MRGLGTVDIRGDEVKHKADWIGYIQNYHNTLLKNLIQADANKK
jgi:hypothetical protein